MYVPLENNLTTSRNLVTTTSFIGGNMESCRADITIVPNLITDRVVTVFNDYMRLLNLEK